MISRYLLIVAVVKYSLVKIQDGGNRKRKWSKSGSLSLLSCLDLRFYSTSSIGRGLSSHPIEESTPMKNFAPPEPRTVNPVSYTHLTLPTIYSV